VFSLYRLLGASEFASLVVVDNGSRDGSVEMLRALDGAGLLHLIANRAQRYHGPALTQGVSWLAARQTDGPPAEQLDYVWILDSDVVVLRADTVRHAARSLEASGAGAVGEPASDKEGLSTYSMLFDPAVVWRPPIAPFVESGDPSGLLQESLAGEGVTTARFPFAEKGYIVHLGRGTLRQIAVTKQEDNRYFAWARTHNAPHYGEWPEAAAQHRSFLDLFEAEVGALKPRAVVEACRRDRLLRLV
jgi:hypothetical protein